MSSTQSPRSILLIVTRSKFWAQASSREPAPLRDRTDYRYQGISTLTLEEGPSVVGSKWLGRPSHQLRYSNCCNSTSRA